MANIVAFFSGKKTYIVAVAMVVLSGLAAQGYISNDVYNLLEGLLLGTGLATLRAGIKK